MAQVALSAPIRYGKYTLFERLGSGGMAEVYLALQEGAGGFSKKVVVKRILAEFADDKTFVDLFLNEAQIAAHLSHPNIVQIFDMGQEADTYFIAMEYVPGPNLLQLLRHATLAHNVPRNAFVKIALGIAEGLHYAHNAHGPDGSPMEIVHRDVNPPNIIVSLDGVPKVCDFGVAKSANRETTSGSHLKGKQTYMAPEQIRGERLDARADVFSLGVVLFETTTGKRLFKRDTELAVLNAVLSDPIPAPSSILSDYPRKLEEIVLWSLERDRNKRCPDARALHDALEDYLRVDPEGYVTQATLGDWVKTVVPIEEQQAYTGASPGKTGSFARPSTKGTGSRSPRPTTSSRRSRPNTAPPVPPEEVSLPISIAVQPPTTEQFTLPSAGAFPWKWVALGAAVMAGAGGVVILGRASAKPEVIVDSVPAAPVAPAAPVRSSEDDARFYTDEARRLLGAQKFGPAAELVAKAKALDPHDPKTNVAIAELSEEAEVGARMAAAQQALASGDLERATGLAKLVLDKEPTEPRALALLEQARGKLEPVKPIRTGTRRDGAVHVEAPPGSRVYVDDAPVGEAPLMRYELAPGPHRVEVRRDGYRPELRTIDVQSSQTLLVAAKMDAKEEVQVALAAPKPAPAPVAAPIAAAPSKPAAVAPIPVPTPAPPPVLAALFTDKMTRPERISGSDPQYPSEAVKQGINGTVLAQCAITEAGAVRDCKVLKHLPFMDQPVIDALQSWRMKPATLDGKPVALRSYGFTVHISTSK